MKKILLYLGLSFCCITYGSQQGLTIREMQQSLDPDTIKVLGITNLTTQQKEYWILSQWFAFYFSSQEDANKCVDYFKDFLSSFGTITPIESRK